MKKSVVNLVVAIIVISIFSLVGVFCYVNYNYKKQIEAQVLIYADLAKIINEFHEKINDLTVSSTNKDVLTNQASKICRIAEDESKKVIDLKYRILTMKGNTIALLDAAEKSQKYISSFPDYIHGSVAKDHLIDRAGVMLDYLEACRAFLNQPGTVDEADTGAAIDRVVLLIDNLKKANKVTTIKRVYSPSAYWSNPSYAYYQEQIRQIVASYSAGRRLLSEVLSHYDRGVITNRDWSRWVAELERRKGLLRQLDNIEPSIPPGSIYREHHQLLRSMLIEAIGAMEQFATNENASSRRYLSIISSKNTNIMNRLKAFYGLR